MVSWLSRAYWEDCGEGYGEVTANGGGNILKNNYHIKGIDRKAIRKEGMKPIPLMTKYCQCLQTITPGTVMPYIYLETRKCSKCNKLVKLT